LKISKYLSGTYSYLANSRKVFLYCQKKKWNIFFFNLHVFKGGVWREGGKSVGAVGGGQGLGLVADGAGGERRLHPERHPPRHQQTHHAARHRSLQHNFIVKHISHLAINCSQSTESILKSFALNLVLFFIE